MKHTIGKPAIGLAELGHVHRLSSCLTSFVGQPLRKVAGRADGQATLAEGAMGPRAR